MYERLLENWLADATEKTFQTPFCQMLIGQGYTILHSSRHSPIEMGKDVIAIDPEGTLKAFQLKTSPSGRLKLKDFRKIQEQMIQLLTQKVVYPGYENHTHLSYLVTNGYIEEEALRAIDDINRSYPDAPGGPLGVCAKGKLIDWAKTIQEGLWPVELRNTNTLLNIYLESGSEELSLEKMHTLLSTTLGLDSEVKLEWKEAEVKRSISSAALITSICLKNFSLRMNHYSVIIGWALFALYAIATCERYKLDFVKNAKPAVDLAVEEIFNKLKDLCCELNDREYYFQGEALVDSVVYRGRYTLLVSLMSIYGLWLKELGETAPDFLNSFISLELAEIDFWGEGIIPQLLVYYWYIRNKDATMGPDLALIKIINKLAKIKLSERIDTSKNGHILAGPYYKFDDVIRYRFGLPLSSVGEDLENDTAQGYSFFIESLFHLIAKKNLKQTCKILWPEISKLISVKFEPGTKWEYCLWRSKSGKETMKKFPLRQEWDEVLKEASESEAEMIPDVLKEYKYLLLLLIVMFPYRATPSLIRYLGNEFDYYW